MAVVVVEVVVGGGVLDVCSVDCFGPELRSGSYFDRFSELIQTCTIPPHWSHIVWWKALLHIWQNRVALHPEPIRVEWVPAHKSDHIPLHEVNETVGQALGIQLRHLRCNRIGRPDCSRAGKLVLLQLIQYCLKRQNEKFLLGKRN